MTNADRKNWLGTWQTDFPCLQVGIHTHLLLGLVTGAFAWRGVTFNTGAWVGDGGGGIFKTAKNV